MGTGLRPVDGLFKRLEVDFTPAGRADLPGRAEAADGALDYAVESHAAAGRAAQRVRQGPSCVHPCRRVLRRRRRVTPAECRHWGDTRRIGDGRRHQFAGVFLEAATGVEPVIKVLQT